MSLLFLDFETYAEVDIRKVGAYRYIEDDSFEPILLSYAIDDEPVNVIEGVQNILAFMEESVPHHEIVGWGEFERLILRKFDFKNIRYENAQIRAAEVGYPLKLEHAAIAAGVPLKKDVRGRYLIPRFCKPVKGVRIYPEDDPERWAEFRDYCGTDTLVMRQIYHRTPELSTFERSLYQLDSKINDRGIGVGVDAVRILAPLATRAEEKLNSLIREASGKQIHSLNQVDVIVQWCKLQGVKLNDLTVDSVDDALLTDLPANVRRVLLCRQAGAKASTKKLAKFTTCVSMDDRIRGVLQFCGAHTRRWGGRLIQPQNFPRDSYGPEEVDALLRLAPRGIAAVARDLGCSPMDSISRALRGLLVPRKGCVFLVADYSAIEARVLAWLAGQLNVLELYLQGKDVYAEAAAAFYGIPVEEVDRATQRFLFKTIVLASGYMLGSKKLRTKTLPNAGITVDEETAKEYIAAFRARYNRVVALWENLKTAAFLAVGEGKKVRVTKKGLFMYVKAGTLIVDLPSGNKLYYHGADIREVPAPWDENPDVKKRKKIKAVTAMMRDEKGWSRSALSPGVFTNNIVQSLSRDIMGAGMLRVEEAGFPIVLTVHDEVVAEVPETQLNPTLIDGETELERFTRLLCELPSWAEGLPLVAEGRVMTRYGK